MLKIEDELSFSEYRLLELNGKKPPHIKKQCKIDGEIFDIFPVYDMQDCIAVKSDKSLKNKTIEFI